MEKKKENSFGLQVMGYKLRVTSCGVQVTGYKLQVAGLMLFMFVAFISKATSLDSLRTETINGKQYIIHQVDAKETLYSISRRYGVPVSDLANENPSAGSGLSVGQVLKVPYVARTKPRTDNGNTIHKVAMKETLFSISRQYGVSVDDIKKWNDLKDNSLSVGQDLVIKKGTTSIASTTKPIAEVAKPTEPVTTTSTIKPANIKTMSGTHTVTEKETFYSISKMYGASVQQLKEWNNLTSTDVKPGQVLFVVPPVSIPEKIQTAQTETAPQTIQPVQEIKISETVIGSEEIHEKGMATIIEGTEGNRKYLAQHKTAKTGSIMKVRNSANNQEVFVRVVAPLTTTDDDTLVKISKSAYDKLGATDPRFTVEVIRYK